MYEYATNKGGLIMDLRGRDLLKLIDYTPEEIQYLIAVAKEFKKIKKSNQSHEFLKGKNIALIFEKDSTRTRCAFEVAGYDLGMGVTYLGPTGSQLGKKETIADTARVLAGMYDGIEYRGFGQDVVEELAKYSKVPVWNGLTDEFHPTQMLADMMTVDEHFGYLKGLHFTCCAPKSLFPKEELIKQCEEYAKASGGSITLTEDVLEGTKNADVLYTDVWVSMGEAPELWQERISLLQKYQVNKEVMNNASPNAIFLHCLPSFHNIDTKIGKEIYEKYGIKEMEVTDEVFESEQSKVMEEAENRMHTIKAVMFETLK